MAPKKEYRSSIRSRRMIRQAFLALLRERPFERITVTDIVNRADINRSTFYAHYEDINDLANSVTDSILEETTKCIQDLDIGELCSDPKPFLHQLFQIGVDNMDLYRLSETSDMASGQFQRIKSIMVDKAVEYMSLPEQLTQSNMFLVQSNFFVGGILNIFELWAAGKLRCSVEEIVEQVAALITNNGYSYQGKASTTTNSGGNV